MLKIGDRFPTFNVKAVVSNDMQDAFVEVNNETDVGSWKVFFFYPKDFTFICPTELVEFNNMHGDFEARSAKVYGGSTDSEFVHLAWRNSDPQLGELKYPLLSDIRRDLSMSLGILERTEGICYRATFIVDPEGVIRHASINDLSVGRNPAEILRTLDALQAGGLCGCGWKKGDNFIEAA
jgi:peroxiredoxin (alkyl hydroperoxide reductase subunit C)